VPIIPVCVSNTSNKINLNRLNNGLVIVEMLPPVDTSQLVKRACALATHCRELMAAKIAELDKEVAEREAAAKNNTGNAANARVLLAGNEFPFSLVSIHGVNMSLSRRQFIKASGVALCAGAAPLKAHAAGQQPALPIPPLLESRRGQPLFLTLQRAHWSFTPGTRASVWGINGRYMGPTIRVWNGDDVKLIYSNRLTENVAMTIRGLQVPGPLIGGAARMMSPNADWAPVLPIRQSAATLWYQANTPNHMAKQVYNGLAGMWLVEDEVSKNLPIPNHYGVDDFPVIIQDKRLDNFGTPEYSEPGSGGFVGDTLLVNGVQSPYVEVSRGWVRLRLLNASNSRRYQLQMSDGRLLHVISGDQGFCRRRFRSSSCRWRRGAS
jgi:suppressor of ftsI